LAADIAVRLVLPDRDLKLGVLMAHRRRAAVPAPDLQDAEAARVTLLSLNGITVRRGECPVVDTRRWPSDQAKWWA
jgi:hypothetical protein